MANNEKTENETKSIYKYLLIGLFLLILGLRLFFAFENETLSYDSYFQVRQAEEIINTGMPLYNDPLSYGGRQLIFLPFFDYLAASLALFVPLDIVAKILPNILVAGIILIVYLIAFKITENRAGAFLSALAAGTLPILFETNSFVPESLFLPLSFMAIYSFISLDNPDAVYMYIISFILLSFTSSATAFLLLGFAIYILLSFIEQKKIPKAEWELILFSLFLFIWIQFLFFKNVLIKEGISFVWQNIPERLLAEYFPAFTISEIIYLAGLIPFLIGIYVIYSSLFKLKNQKSFLLISLVISTSIFAALKLIEFKLALMFSAIILAILLASFYKEITTYLQKTKLSHLKNWQDYILTAIVLIIILTTAYPLLEVVNTQDLPSQEEIEAFKWIKDNTPEEAAILGLVKEGHLITYYSQRKNLMDDKFNLIDDVEQRSENLKLLFTTPFQTLAVNLLEKYQIDYLALTPSARERFQISKFKYVTGCFKKVYDDSNINIEGTKIYKARCQIVQSQGNK